MKVEELTWQDIKIISQCLEKAFMEIIRKRNEGEIPSDVTFDSNEEENYGNVLKEFLKIRQS